MDEQLNMDYILVYSAFAWLSKQKHVVVVMVMQVNQAVFVTALQDGCLDFFFFQFWKCSFSIKYQVLPDIRLQKTRWLFGNFSKFIIVLFDVGNVWECIQLLIYLILFDLVQSVFPTCFCVFTGVGYREIIQKVVWAIQWPYND